MLLTLCVATAIHLFSEYYFSHVWHPSESATSPNLLGYQGFEVRLYVYALGASHLWQISSDSEIANCRI